MPTEHLKPHDVYFERVFKVLPVVLELIGQIFSEEQQALLDITTLTLAPESFISEEFAESFSDLIYTCDAKGGAKVRICLLFEHKSRRPGRRIYTQVGHYLIGVQEEDINQHREYFSLTITVLFYHGKEAWNPGSVLSQYGPIPSVFHEFVPNFNFIVVNLQKMKDEEIMSMGDAMLLRNIYLAMKHAREDDFFRQNYRKIFIFAGENVPEDILLSLFYSTFTYIQMVSTLKKEEIMEMVQTLPPQYEQRAKTTYEQFVETGFLKGIEKGMEQGIEKEKYAFAIKLWSLQEFPFDKIVTLTGLGELQITHAIVEFLKSEGIAEEAAIEQIERFKNKIQ